MIERTDRDDDRPRTGRGHSAHPTSEPWSAVIPVATVPASGLERTLVATPTERAALAAAGGLRDVLSARADIVLLPIRDNNIRLTGRLTARIGQTCVVTLDPIETDIADDIDLTFAPPEQIRDLAQSVADAATGGDIPDPPEPIMEGTIDIGRVATDALYLAIDPYPRKPDAEFSPPVVAEDPDDHPFAALKVMKTDPDTSAS